MKTAPTQKVRCAIYSRKSTEEGLSKDFNSLDAQREACEAYIVSQKALGWLLVGEGGRIPVEPVDERLPVAGSAGAVAEEVLRGQRGELLFVPRPAHVEPCLRDLFREHA